MPQNFTSTDAKPLNTSFQPSEPQPGDETHPSRNPGLNPPDDMGAAGRQPERVQNASPTGGTHAPNDPNFADDDALATRGARTDAQARAPRAGSPLPEAVVATNDATGVAVGKSDFVERHPMQGSYQRHMAATRDPADQPVPDPFQTGEPVPDSLNTPHTVGVRAASSTHPSAPLPAHLQYAKPSKAYEEADDPDPESGLVKGHDGTHRDARLHAALDLARRGLSYASINDLSKAVLLMLDVHHNGDAGTSKIAQDLAAGKEPSLL